MDQNDPISPESTAQALAKEHGVSEGTVKRAGKFAEEAEPLAGRIQGGAWAARHKGGEEEGKPAHQKCHVSK